MIRTLTAVVGAVERRTLTGLVAWISVAAVLQGVVYALSVPVLRAVFGPQPDDAWRYLIALLLISLLWAAVSYGGLRRGMESGAMLSRGLRHRIGDHVATLPLGWFGPARLGELATMTGATVMSIAAAPAHLLRPFIGGFLTPVTVVVAMYFLDWRLAAAATITVPIIAVVYRWSNALVGAADRRRGAAVADAGGRVIEFARAQPVLRAFGRTDRGGRVLDEALVVQRDASRRVLLAMVPGLIGFTLVIQAALTAVLAYGTYLALGAHLDAASLMAVLVLVARFVEPMTDAAALGSALTRSANAIAQVKNVLDVPPLPEPAHSPTPEGATITFDGVSFGYPEDVGTSVLTDVSFAIPEGSVTALVGPSGAGKTTVTRLIARFYDVDSGTVCIGGVDVREMSTEVLMAQIATVFQDVVLFSGSILDNIRLGRAGASDDEVRAAARAAQVDEIVHRLPDGWDTEVGEGGASLSGGERQRVSIARAILKNAPIVLLDEATSALDPDNEYAVHEALAALTARRTLLVVAHRLSTIAAADQILVLADHGIAERGTHDELLRLGGRYAAFWSTRTRAASWRLTGA